MDRAYLARQITTPDENGRLLTHRTLLSRNALLGTINLMIAQNSISICVAEGDCGVVS